MILGLIELALVVVLCLSGVHIAIAMGMVGIAAAWIYYGDVSGVYLAGITAWDNCTSWSLSMIPLFVFMGSLVAACGLGRDAFDCFNKWLSKIRGSLAIVATVTSAVFGAITGSTPATIVTIGGITVPEMKRLGYSIPLRTGSIAVAGILANLIPPSIIAIIYCTLTEASIGKVFMAGLIPGVILTLFFAITIYIWVSLNPSIAPVPSESYTFKEKVASLKLPLPIIGVFVLMMGGIYTGIFSPTEAAGIGAGLVLILVIIMKRLTWKRLIDALSGTVRITAFLMFIIMGGMLFAHTIALTHFPTILANTILGWALPPIALMFTVIAAIIVLGCVLDVMGLLVLFIPLFLPVIIEIGFDPVWYGTLSVMLVEIALITPPVAGNIYFAQAVDPESTVISVTRGVVPFYAAALVLVALLVFFPQIALWLPSMMT